MLHISGIKSQNLIDLTYYLVDTPTQYTAYTYSIILKHIEDQKTPNTVEINTKNKLKSNISRGHMHKRIAWWGYTVSTKLCFVLYTSKVN